MGEKHLNNFVSISVSLYSMISLLGCTAEPTLSTQNTNELGLVERESVREVLVLPTSDSVLLGPGESVTIRHTRLHQPHYLCSTGRPLECQRIGLRSHCFCPGKRDGT